MPSPLQPLRLRLGRLLLGWGERLLTGGASGAAEVTPALMGSAAMDLAGSGAAPATPPGSAPAASRSDPTSPGDSRPQDLAASPGHGPPKPLDSAPQVVAPAPLADAGSGPASLTPALRRPVSIEKAVLKHDLRVLRREAADALAALGAAHALVSSARLAQVQELRQQVGHGGVTEETLLRLAADYQGWVNDQVRLFDALSMVMRMRIPAGRVLEQVDPAMRPQACSHLEMLCLEYERQQLNQRFAHEASPDKDSPG